MNSFHTIHNKCWQHPNTRISVHLSKLLQFIIILVCKKKLDFFQVQYTEFSDCELHIKQYLRNRSLGSKFDSIRDK